MNNELLLQLFIELLTKTKKVYVMNTALMNAVWACQEHVDIKNEESCPSDLIWDVIVSWNDLSIELSNFEDVIERISKEIIKD